ncbi:MAG: 2-amino-4-hydroxy-6-hydroxymethyldihydropteridine diphosphokinase, partial [Planctomycetes bacterium]|nr:2-amino-4-hydroxy-6-hydroxymethyldihydropteridine diphosphokinase [Planctomycetota bacterium]
HRLERAIGRRRDRERIAWSPRVIDIDILLWEGVAMAEPDLIIPHPRLAARAFALAPLTELAPTLTHPALGVGIAELLQRNLRQHEGIRRLSI